MSTSSAAGAESGSKRKVGTVVNTEEETANVATTSTSTTDVAAAEEDSSAPVEHEAILALDAELEAGTADILNCTNTELQQRSVALQRAKENRIAAADRYRKMQIRNIMQLYEYDIENSEAAFKKEFSDLQEELLSALKEDIEDRKAEVRAVLEAEAAAAAAVAAADAATAVANSNANSSSNSSRSRGDPGPTSRSTRSSGLAEPIGDIDAILAGSSTGNSGSSGGGTARTASRKKASAPALSVDSLALDPTANALEKVLGNSSIRADFLEIVSDLQQQAMLYAAHKQSVLMQQCLESTGNNNKNNDTIIHPSDILPAAASSSSSSSSFNLMRERQVVSGDNSSGTIGSSSSSSTAGAAVAVARKGEQESMRNVLSPSSSSSSASDLAAAKAAAGTTSKGNSTGTRASPEDKEQQHPQPQPQRQIVLQLPQVLLAPDMTGMSIGGALFHIGDRIVAFSILAQESIIGELTAITSNVIIIRNEYGARFSFLMGHIRSGRVVLSKDPFVLQNTQETERALAAAEADNLMLDPTHMGYTSNSKNKAALDVESYAAVETLEMKRRRLYLENGGTGTGRHARGQQQQHFQQQKSPREDQLLTAAAN